MPVSPVVAGGRWPIHACVALSVSQSVCDELSFEGVIQLAKIFQLLHHVSVTQKLQQQESHGAAGNRNINTAHVVSTALCVWSLLLPPSYHIICGLQH